MTIRKITPSIFFRALSCKDNTLLTADVIGGNAVNTCDNRAAMTLFTIEYCVIAARFLQTFSLLPQIPLRFISG